MHTLDKEQKETWEENSWCLKVVGLWMIHLYIHSFWNCYNVHSIINKTWKGKHSSEAFSVPGRKISDAWDHFAFFLAPSKQPVIFIHMQGICMPELSGDPPSPGRLCCLFNGPETSLFSVLFDNKSKVHLLVWFFLDKYAQRSWGQKMMHLFFLSFLFLLPIPPPPSAVLLSQYSLEWAQNKSNNS